MAQAGRDGWDSRSGGGPAGGTEYPLPSRSAAGAWSSTTWPPPASASAGPESHRVGTVRW